MRVARRAGTIAAVLAGLLVLAGAAGFLWLRTSLPQTDGTLRVAGLENPVAIIRDRNAIPHIFADSAHDAYFALGFVHAQDRIWQMVLLRRLASGRLAEILGTRALGSDKYYRTLGLRRIAAAILRQTTPDTRAVLDAYAAGVNAWRDGRSERGDALPPEFLLLGFEPEAWRPVDSLLWSRLMALRLGRNRHTELTRMRIAEALSANGLAPGLLDELWPASGGPVTIDPSVRAAAALFDGLPEGIAADSGSNGWAVAGRHTKSGKPILANDPHLRFGAPILWYLARLEAPGLRLVGATAPGVPFMILGHNGSTAWGMTSADGDAEDHFIETVDAADPTRYLTPDGPRSFVTRQEVIRVKDAADVVITVRETRHGPVISDLSGNLAPAGRVVALASTALRPGDRTAEALLAISRARDWTEFRAAATLFHAPHTNLFFAATDGDIGMVSAGRLPIRKAGDGRVPVPGAAGRHDWTGYIPMTALPTIHAPPSGIIVNANNRTIGDGYPYLLTRDWSAGYRAERIVEVLAARDRHDLQSTAALQQDTLSTAARRLIPLMTRIEPRGAAQTRALTLLRRWDFTMRRGRPEPLIYAAWLRQLGGALAADKIGGPRIRACRGLVNSPGPDFIAAALTYRRHWCDDVKTPAVEDCASRLSLSLGRTLAEIEAALGPDMATWRWGALHRARFAHPILTTLPVLSWLADLDIETDGGRHTVNRGGYSPTASFTHRDGAGYRAIYDLGDLDNSRFVIATGQSGNFLSPHYRDFLHRWRDGGAVRIAGSRRSLAAADTLTLEPIN